MRLQKNKLELQELQGAQICSLLYNINRDSKKGKSTTHRDWQFFFDKEEVKEEDELPPVVAHICLALKHEGMLPPLLVGLWKHVVKRSAIPCEVPEIRALVNEDQTVVALAPTWEGSNIRAFFASKGHKEEEIILLRDIDRPLLKYSIVVPNRTMAVHFQEGALLLSSERVKDKDGLMAISSKSL